MNRKNFLGTLGLAAGAAMTGFGRDLAGSSSMPPELNLPIDEDIWKVVRNEFSFPEGYVYLNTGGIGSVPRHVRSLFSDEWFKLETNPTPGHDSNKWNALKKDMAAFLGKDVEASEIALISSATEGINIILNGLPFQKGDEVITTQHEHPALNIPLLNMARRKGIVIKTFDPDRNNGLNNLKLVESLTTKKTRLIFVSQRLTTTGQLLPVRELGEFARAKGIFYALDAAQVPGSMPVDVKDMKVDFYTFSTHKWLLAPRRTGVLYVASEKLDSLEPVTVGAYSDNGYSIKDGTLKFQQSCQKFEYGTQNELLYLGLHASLKFVNSIGVDRIRQHNEALSEEFYSRLTRFEKCEVLSPAEREYRSSMITFRIKGKTLNEMSGAMSKDNIRVRPVGEAGLDGIRISFHLYNDGNDLDRAVESIRKIIES
ncbi:MAG: aminotransferase class V-fold PLP-dependent enzyme [Bacteroidales bacterium]